MDAIVLKLFYTIGCIAGLVACALCVLVGLVMCSGYAGRLLKDAAAWFDILLAVRKIRRDRRERSQMKMDPETKVNINISVAAAFVVISLVMVGHGVFRHLAAQAGATWALNAAGLMVIAVILPRVGWDLASWRQRQCKRDLDDDTPKETTNEKAE